MYVKPVWKLLPAIADWLRAPHSAGPPGLRQPSRLAACPAWGSGRSGGRMPKAFPRHLRMIIPLSRITQPELKLIFSGMLQYTESQNITHWHWVFPKYHKILQYFMVETTEAEPWLTEGSWEQNWSLSPTTKTLYTLCPSRHCSGFTLKV